MTRISALAVAQAAKDRKKRLIKAGGLVVLVCLIFIFVFGGGGSSSKKCQHGSGDATNPARAQGRDQRCGYGTDRHPLGGSAAATTATAAVCCCCGSRGRSGSRSIKAGNSTGRSGGRSRRSGRPTRRYRDEGCRGRSRRIPRGGRSISISNGQIVDRKSSSSSVLFPSSQVIRPRGCCRRRHQGCCCCCRGTITGTCPGSTRSVPGRAYT
mmetsp:Transcript_3079/g.6676  ORF Transcript_3079/g.6676 Transcript_3079/m.6676 type:complete len:211 (+) Transcript_3079:128-760(+)